MAMGYMRVAPEIGQRKMSLLRTIMRFQKAGLGSERPKNKGGNLDTLKYASIGSESEPILLPPTLAELGLDKKRAARRPTNAASG
jgi:hypothetical protein